MRKHIPGLLALFSILPLTHSLGQIENETISKTLAFIKSHETFLCHAGQKYETDPHEVIAIGYPFLIEHFQKENASAHNGIESIYIHLGGRESNLKAGEFQLKSSMVENIEKVLSRHPRMFSRFQFLTQFKQTDERSIRAERILRMKNVEWQFHYLFAFKAIADTVFFGEDFKSITEKITFYSVAFHLGFERRFAEIKDCYRSFSKKNLNKNLKDCKYRASLTVDFIENYAPILDCTEEVVKW